MSGRIFISHSASDAQLGGLIAEFLDAMIAGASVTSSTLPGRAPESLPERADDSLAAIKQRLASADVVLGLITPQALASGEVPFQLGAAWALGTRLVLLLEPDASAAALYLPMGQAEARVLGPETLLELASALANGAGLRADVDVRARAALAQLFPGFTGLDRESSERAVVPARSGSTGQHWPVNDDADASADASTDANAKAAADFVRPGLPSCGASLQAGRAVSDCVFHREAGGRFAEELDLPFGTFLTALGTDWSALRELEDLDVWAEAAENVLDTLAPAERHVRFFYEIGVQLSTLLNLANLALESDEPATPELQQAWRDAWGALCSAALQARVTATELDALAPLVENLYAPLAERDFANLGRIQERVRALASGADAAVLSASA